MASQRGRFRLTVPDYPDPDQVPTDLANLVDDLDDNLVAVAPTLGEIPQQHQTAKDGTVASTADGQLLIKSGATGTQKDWPVVAHSQAYEYLPAWTSGVDGTPGVVGTGSLGGRYWLTGSLVHVNVFLTMESDTVPPVGYWRFSLPFVGTSPFGLRAGTGSGDAIAPGSSHMPLLAFSNAVGQFSAFVASSNTLLSGTTATWSAGSYATLWFQYEGVPS